MKTKLIIIFLLTLTSTYIKAQPNNSRWEYVQRFKGIAAAEMRRTGIPASIKLAQGILESAAGTSVLSRKANNHFGIKCGSEWRGPTYYIKDDDYDENGQLIESCFRVYEDAESSYIAHSEFLRDPNKAYRYGFLFRLDQKDYKKWAQGLRSAGYATSPTYGDALIQIIEQYKLYNYDGDSPNMDFDIVRLINDVKMTLAKSGQTPDDISKKYNVKTSKLLKYNEGLRGPNQPLGDGEYVFLQRKRWFYRGKEKYHYVKEGEDMYKISQLYGLKLSRLYKKNRMEEGTQPAVGEKVRLRCRVRRGASPKLRSATPVDNITIPVDDGNGTIIDTNPASEVDPDDLKSPSENLPIDTVKTLPTIPNNSNSNNNTTKPTNTTTIPTTTNNKPTTPTTNTTKPNTSTSTTTTKPTTPTTNTPIAKVIHIVKSGETLYGLSRQYGVSVEQIKTLNNLDTNNIKIGQALIIKK